MSYLSSVSRTCSNMIPRNIKNVFNAAKVYTIANAPAIIAFTSAIALAELEFRIRPHIYHANGEAHCDPKRDSLGCHLWENYASKIPISRKLIRTAVDVTAIPTCLGATYYSLKQSITAIRKFRQRNLLDLPFYVAEKVKKQISYNTAKEVLKGIAKVVVFVGILNHFYDII